MGRTRYKFLEDDISPYFITSTVVEWLPLLNDGNIIQIIVESLSFLQKEKRIVLYAYVIMKTHLHLVASSDNLSKEIANFRSYTARRSIDYLKVVGKDDVLQRLKNQKLARLRGDREHQFWQEGVQPKQISSYKMMAQKVFYIHDNPVRRGYVEKAEAWEYSSARIYAGQSGVLAVCLDW